MTQLEKLHIASNSLFAVPEVVSSLTSLKELDMYGCRLSDLPERFVCQNVWIVLNIQYLKS